MARELSPSSPKVVDEEPVIEKTTMLDKAFEVGKALVAKKAAWLEQNPNWTTTVYERLPQWTKSFQDRMPNWVSSIHGRLPPWVVEAPLRQVSHMVSTKGRRRSAPLRPTSYLDGLRGFAALLVYILHHQLWAHDSLKADSIFENAFGYNRQFYFVCLPFIRTFFSGGHLAVAVFFVISGYVLSAKPLALLRAGEHGKLNDNLASAVFRRWMRLFIPIISTTFLYMTANYLIRGLSARKTEAKYFDEVSNWYSELMDFAFVFRTGGDPWFTYNFHVWTIPLEFKGSIAIYTALMAFSRCTKNARLLCQIGLIFYFLYVVDGWYCALFIAGMLHCDLDFMAQEDELPRFFSIFEPQKHIIFPSLFVAGLYLGGVPSYSGDLEVLRTSPGWYYLSFLKPHAVYNFKSFYLFWAGVFIVISVQRIAWLKSFFELPFNQYMGRISYAFYLVHGPLLWTVGDRVYAAVGLSRGQHSINIPKWTNTFRLPRFGPLGLEFNFLAAQLFLFPFTLYVARFTTMVFDEPAINFSKWLYKRVTGPSTRLSPTDLEPQLPS